MELDIVGARRIHVKADGDTDYERDGFGFGLTDGLRSLIPALAPVQEFMRGFVDENGEFLSRWEIRQQGDLATGRHTFGGRDTNRVFERDALSGDEIFEARGEALRVALSGGELRQCLAVSLADVEDVDRAEPHARVLVVLVLLSPAGTSFDSYASFEVRGERFRTLVRELPGFVPEVQP